MRRLLKWLLLKHFATEMQLAIASSGAVKVEFTFLELSILPALSWHRSFWPIDTAGMWMHASGRQTPIQQPWGQSSRRRWGLTFENMAFRFSSAVGISEERDVALWTEESVR